MTIRKGKTIGEIAEQEGEPVARVAYIVSKLRLKPSDRIGIVRLFGDEQIKAIRQGLYNIQIRGAQCVR